MASRPRARHEADVFTSLTDAAPSRSFAGTHPLEEPMQTLDHDQDSVHIDAPPQVVYALVADVTRTPEFSPEILRCTWLDGAAGPAVGARFQAVNKVSRGPAWKNRPVVVAAQPDREFAFSRSEKLAGTLVWRYLLEPDGTGTALTESYQVTRPISWLGWFVIGRLFGCHDRRAELARRHAAHVAADPRNRRARGQDRPHIAGHRLHFLNCRPCAPP
jgi:hypothetical protein